jgi:hypothetical protein
MVSAFSFAIGEKQVQNGVDVAREARNGYSAVNAAP